MPQVCVSGKPRLHARSQSQSAARTPPPRRARRLLPPRREAIDDLGSIGQPGCANGRGGGAQAAEWARCKLQAAAEVSGPWGRRGRRGVPSQELAPRYPLRSPDRLPGQPGLPGLLGAGWESRVQGRAWTILREPA